MKQLLVFAALITASVAHAFLIDVPANLESPGVPAKWIALPKDEQSSLLSKAVDPLTKLAIADALSNWEACVDQARKVPAKSLVKLTVLTLELKCARKVAQQEGKLKIFPGNGGQVLAQTLRRLEGITLKSAGDVASAQIELVEWYGKHASWKDLRAELQKVFKKEQSFEKALRARAYFQAGELLVAERKWSQAYLHYQRSVDLGGDAAAEGRIKGLLSQLPKDLRETFLNRGPKAGASEGLATGPLVPAPPEQDLVSQAEAYLVRGDIKNGAEAITEVLKKFPNGVRAKWAQDKLYELLINEVARSRGPEGDSVNKKKILDSMSELEEDRLFEWGRGLFESQSYTEAAQLLKEAYQKNAASPKAGKNAFYAARAFQLSNQLSDAKKMYQILVSRFPAASEVVDGTIQWALINISENEPSEAIVHLEMARARKMTNQQDLISLYWLYQAYKMRKYDTGVQQAGRELMARFPLTFYGLTAAQELNGTLPKFDKDQAPKVTLQLSEAERDALARARILINAGLTDAAQEELSVFSERPLSLEESEYVAGLYAQALKYPKAIGLFSQVFDGAIQRRGEVLVKKLFPKEFWNIVSDEKVRSNVDPYLLLSVMRQESAFDPKITSRSNAKGLMQMIPPTAEDVKREIKSKANVPDDLYDPWTNVRFCAHYLAQLIKKADGNVAVALASYNAGPTRISSWLKARGQKIPETWVDELPWSETSLYVKSILKNYLVYRILYKGLDRLPTPPWAEIN